jgi:hypothetical protein
MDSTLDELGPVMSFEAPNDALVIWLNVRCKICLEVFNSDVLEIGGDNMTREIVLEKELSVSLLEVRDPNSESSLDTAEWSSTPSHCSGNKILIVLLTSSEMPLAVLPFR